MARFLLSPMPFSGHVAPILAVAEALAHRGNDVRVYTGAAFRDSVERVGARLVPWTVAPDFDEQDLPATFPRLVGRKGLRQLLINMQDLFIATAPQQLADARAEWEREPWDVLVADEASLGPRLMADELGCRWATAAVLPLYLLGTEGPPPGLPFGPGRTALTRARDATLRTLIPVISAPLTRAARAARRSAGLAPVSGVYGSQLWSRELILASGVSSLDDDRKDRPGHLHWVGRLAMTGASQIPLPAWWGDLDGRRVVHVTQGTQNVDPADLLRPAVDALADLDVMVVASTGIKEHEALPFSVPSNVRTAALLPYDLLLPRTELVITNGGWGGVLASLANSIPLIIAGGDLDKPEVARRVASTGAGIDLRTGTPSAVQVRAGVDLVLSDPRFRQRAGRIATELAAAGGAASAADLLERFAAAGRSEVRP